MVAWVRLPARWRSVGEFDAVVDRVADQMHQRVGELVQHAAIQFGVGTFDLPADVLALGPRQVADGPLELVGDRGDGNHLGPHRAILQVVEHPGLLVELGAGRRVDLEPVLEHEPDSQVSRGRFTDQSGEFLQSLERNHDDCGGAVRQRAELMVGELIAGDDAVGRRGPHGRRRSAAATGGGWVPLPVPGPPSAGTAVRATVLGGADGGAELVSAQQQGVDHFRGHWSSPDPQLVDQLLQVMGDPADVIESGHRRGALEGVDLAEDGAYEGLVVAGLLQLEQ